MANEVNVIYMTMSLQHFRWNGNRKMERIEVRGVEMYADMQCAVCSQPQQTVTVYVRGTHQTLDRRITTEYMVTVTDEFVRKILRMRIHI